MWSEIVLGILFPMLVCSALIEEGDMRFIEFFTKPVEKDQDHRYLKTLMTSTKQSTLKSPEWLLHLPRTGGAL